jgi:hypothetical protein
VPIRIVVFGVLVIYALVRVGGLAARAAIAALCRSVAPRAPAAMRRWLERQGAYSFRAGWAKLWSSEERR